MVGLCWLAWHWADHWVPYSTASLFRRTRKLFQKLKHICLKHCA